jgi:hypothetical protein
VLPAPNQEVPPVLRAGPPVHLVVKLL